MGECQFFKGYILKVIDEKNKVDITSIKRIAWNSVRYNSNSQKKESQIKEKDIKGSPQRFITWFMGKDIFIFLTEVCASSHNKDNMQVENKKQETCDFLKKYLNTYF